MSFELLVIAAGSAAIVLVSWRALRKPSSHGFWRFWAWEAILVLLARGLPLWFAEPFSPRQLLSWLLLLASIPVLLLGVTAIRRQGRRGGGEEGELYAFERTGSLVTTGIFGLIRHPLYASLLYLCWGACLKRPDAPGLAIAVLGSAFLFATARIEEGENLGVFGEAYRDYMGRTRMFIPFIF